MLPVVIAGLFLVLVVLISIYFIKRHLRLGKRLGKTVETLSYELKELEKVPTVETTPVAATNPISSMGNSRYFCPDGTQESSSSSDGYDVIREAMIIRSDKTFYDEVAPDEIKAVVTKPAAIYREENRGEDDDSGLYATIPSIVITSMQAHQSRPRE